MATRCEDYPCCGHELNDCDGSLYGSDEAIKAEVYKHSRCEHEAGYCAVWDEDFEEDEDEDQGYDETDLVAEDAMMEYALGMDE